MLFVRMRLRCPSGNSGSRYVVVSPTPLAQAVRGGLQPPGLHLRGDGLRLCQGGFPGFHGEYRLQGRRRPLPVGGRRLGEHVAHEVHHAPLVSRLRQHGIDRGDEPGAPVSDHQPDALEAAFDHASDELLPAVPVLLHALGDADDLPVTLGVHADGDEHAHVLHVPAPGALVPHAVHEHVRILRFQRPRAPRVDVLVHLLEFVAQCLRGHAVSPQQLADVVDPPGAHAGQVHVDQGFLDALLTPPVAFDDGGFEDRAFELGHLQSESAGFGCELAFVVAGPVCLPLPSALVSGGVGDLVRLKRRASR